MREPQAPRVEHLSGRSGGRRRRAAGTVDRVAQNGMTGGGEVNADLVCAPRLELNRDQRSPPGPLDRPVSRHRAPSLLPAPSHAAAALSRIPDQIRIEDAEAGQSPLHQRHVLPFDAMRSKEILEKPKRFPVAREDDRSGRVAVDPVNDEGDRPPAIAAVKVVEDSREKSVPLPGGSGNGEQPRGLVDDEQILVFEEHREPRLNSMARRAVRMERKSGLSGNLASRLVARLVVDVHAACPDGLPGRSAPEVPPERHGGVEPHRARGTRIVTKNWGSPIRASRPAPGPKEETATKRSLTNRSRATR